jgi:hypothetical protein
VDSGNLVDFRVLFQEFSAGYSLPGGFRETYILGLALADPFQASDCVKISLFFPP